MKKISEMNVDEMAEEIKGYLEKFDGDENYVFVSYSHKDCEKVYPVVLKWMREGYNIYLDLDFENHSGNANWVTQMKNRIRSNSCQLVTCFYSENYCFSYPAMIEFLTIYSNETKKDREYANYEILPIDIISLDAAPKDDGKNFSSPEVKNQYKTYFKQMKEKIGAELWKKNQEEENLCLEGLITLYEKDDNPEKAANDIILRIKKAYKDESITNFYPIVAMIIHEVRNKNNLNGNNNSLSKYNENIRFKGKDSLEIYKFDRNYDESEDPYKVDLVDTDIKNTESEKEEKTAAMVEEIKKTDEVILCDEKAETFREIPDGMLYYDHAIGKDNLLGGIVVLKGSRINKSEANSCPEGAKKNRRQALADGRMTDEGSYYLLQKDIEFKSLSGAACFVSGTSVNGKTVWKSDKKDSTARVISSSGAENAGVSSKINQICMVVKKVCLEPKPIENYTKTIAKICGDVADELNIGKSSVVDKCQRQLGLKAAEFAIYVRNYNESDDDTLYNIVMQEARNDDERSLVRASFGKN